MPGSPPEVDIPTAKELIEQIHEHISPEVIGELTGELAGKAERMHALLGGPDLGAGRVRAAVELTFVGRRRASAILGTRDDDVLARWVSDLLTGPDPIDVRVERFCAQAGELSPAAAVELAGELLHFTAPRDHWLFSRWMWSQESRTGALALLIGEEYELDADGLGEGYLRVGAAVAALHDSPEAGAFRLHGGGRFGTDVLLACTYGIYMRTVLGLKMTQEFNALVPALPQLVRRLLGTHVKPAQEAR
ncbi:hypothetical protein [Conexibacter sp. DBS9H8]|uniref:hypothetical protein n=1 Tax=Conexibacter sp. DBS9H8 TaxID=2937801 RepID=UPI00200EF18E|nr:hypothetical protein [Conexibacter sp. DBS9H8]